MNHHFLSQIILQASCYKPTSVSDSLALDDVHIIRGKSCFDIIPTTTPNPATTTTAAPASAMDCTFEQGDEKNKVSEETERQKYSAFSRGLQSCIIIELKRVS